MINKLDNPVSLLHQTTYNAKAPMLDYDLAADD